MIGNSSDGQKKTPTLGLQGVTFCFEKLCDGILEKTVVVFKLYKKKS